MTADQREREQLIAELVAAAEVVLDEQASPIERTKAMERLRALKARLNEE